MCLRHQLSTAALNAHFQVWHHSSICVTWSIHICYVAAPNTSNTVCCNDSFIRRLWLICKYMSHNLLIMWDINHLYVLHDLSIPVMWQYQLSQTTSAAATHLYKVHTHLRVGCYSSICGTRNIIMCNVATPTKSRQITVSVDMTHKQ